MVFHAMSTCNTEFLLRLLRGLMAPAMLAAHGIAGKHERCEHARGPRRAPRHPGGNPAAAAAADGRRARRRTYRSQTWSRRSACWSGSTTGATSWSASYGAPPAPGCARHAPARPSAKSCSTPSLTSAGRKTPGSSRSTCWPSTSCSSTAARSRRCAATSATPGTGHQAPARPTSPRHSNPTGPPTLAGSPVRTGKWTAASWQRTRTERLFDLYKIYVLVGRPGSAEASYVGPRRPVDALLEKYAHDTLDAEPPPASAPDKEFRAWRADVRDRVATLIGENPPRRRTRTQADRPQTRRPVRPRAHLGPRDNHQKPKAALTSVPMTGPRPTVD